jgi:hypothetical protein
VCCPELLRVLRGGSYSIAGGCCFVGHKYDEADEMLCWLVIVLHIDLAESSILKCFQQVKSSLIISKREMVKAPWLGLRRLFGGQGRFLVVIFYLLLLYFVTMTVKSQNRLCGDTEILNLAIEK